MCVGLNPLLKKSFIQFTTREYTSDAAHWSDNELNRLLPFHRQGVILLVIQQRRVGHQLIGWVGGTSGLSIIQSLSAHVLYPPPGPVNDDADDPDDSDGSLGFASSHNNEEPWSARSSSAPYVRMISAPSWAPSIYPSAGWHLGLQRTQLKFEIARAGRFSGHSRYKFEHLCYDIRRLGHIYRIYMYIYVYIYGKDKNRVIELKGNSK